MCATVVHSHWKVSSTQILFSKTHTFKELLSVVYIGSILLLLTAFAVFLLEQELDKETKFASMGDALWWAFITFYSVGYGDISPTTWAGKLVASCCTVFGMIFFLLISTYDIFLGMIVFNLPSGIVGAGLALQVSQKCDNRNTLMKVYADTLLIKCMKTLLFKFVLL